MNLPNTIEIFQFLDITSYRRIQGWRPALILVYWKATATMRTNVLTNTFLCPTAQVRKWHYFDSKFSHFSVLKIYWRGYRFNIHSYVRVHVHVSFPWTRGFNNRVIVWKFLYAPSWVVTLFSVRGSAIPSGIPENTTTSFSNHGSHTNTVKRRKEFSKSLKRRDLQAITKQLEVS